MRNGIEWMKKGPYGIMVHYTSSIYDKNKEFVSDFNEMADMFDVPAFMDNIEKIGAKWLIFTVTHGTGKFWSENPEIEKVFPGNCSKRDLVVEIADACKEKGVKFILYFPTEIDNFREDMRKAFKWDESADKKEFMEMWMNVIRYYAVKLGDRLDGWWFDSAYESREKPFKRTYDWNNERFDRNAWFDAARAGNPDCKIALCRGADDRSYVFFEQDYFAGECSDLSYVPKQGVQDGIQHHSLVWIDSYWAVGKAAGDNDFPDAPRFSDDELFDWIKKHNEIGSAVTLNIGIFADSSLIDDTISQLVRIRERLGK